MKDFVIVTDSSSDLLVDIVKKYNIVVIGLPCNFKGEEIKEDSTYRVDLNDFYESMNKGEMPRTSMANPTDFINVFEDILNKGKDIIYISLSSGLSSTYNSSLIAKESLLSTYKDAKIETIDSLSAAAAQGLLVYEACKLKEKGESFEKVVNWLNDNVQKLNLWFMVDSLDHLKRGGRISLSQALIGNVLNIKPILTIDSKGKLVVVDKVRGRKKGMKALLEVLQNRCDDINNSVVCILHGNCEEDSKNLEEEIKKLSPLETLITPVRIVIGTHTGPGALAIAFFGNNRKG